MMGWRGAGILVTFLLGCGETSHGSESLPTGGGASAMGGRGAGNESAGNATGGNAMSGGANAGKGGTPDPHPVAGAGGVDAMAGAAGAGGEPCAGAEPRCEPGEQACDPWLGKVGTCDECGMVTHVDEAGADCVRLLASDKESNGVCAVLGKDRLECWPEAFEVKKTTLPPGIVEVLLPDDYTPQSRNGPCLRDAANGYSCGFDGCDGRVVVGDAGVCGLCDGELHCRELSSEPPEVQQPIDISLTDGNLLVLSPLGVHAFGETRLPSGWRGAPAELLVDHRFGGCVISDQREMACWLEFSEGFQPASWQGSFKKIIGSTFPRACALDDARQLRCGNVFEDSAPAPYGEPDTIDFVASSSTVCALSVAGRVKCWNDATGDPKDVASGW